MIDQKIVEHVAHLARIDLEPKELEKLSMQLEHIIGFIDKLKQANVDNVLPISHAIAASNVLREDVLKKSLSQDKALANAPSKKGSFFVVPKVIE
ncbi:MAG: Asp-tRNA(Asn)/Glu-tRNA(Gln) amidotransferase GatCAB subunit C [Candidatus Omnitrophica bacterium CG23_combo_of_CG06-09_8_20_14_all_41_10]|uniref:Aspartyl/glutamyl-tRNA(Asn/Gln) amidotransferase subunit C n=1 Tax=Candidatus Sherwoodlollariibacterium unditelluris TaxID=1974757 RepID=A0A2G9YI30_9BACT|nr:MAG: Asp-tRNA(Asn)/Glu-tRNA(Gln) amidotransferase GatCAB subunit C [Candidatus Omnitrophica bacterium CG23_combo_of_CG06-09_8_20_14_all_41_10]